MIDELSRIAAKASTSLDHSAAGAIRPPMHALVQSQRRPLALRLGMVAVVGAGAAVATFALLPQRSGEDQGSRPSAGAAQTAAAVQLLVPDELPAGYQVESVEIYGPQSRVPADVFVRIYATTTARPERGITFTVQTIPTGAETGPVADPDARLVAIGGPAPVAADGSVSGDLPVATVRSWCYITPFGVTDDEFRIIASTARWAPDGRGVMLDPSVLPEGVAERHAEAIGSDGRLLSTRSASQRRGTLVQWSHPVSTATVQLEVVPADDAYVDGHRVLATELEEISVGGHEGIFIWTQSGIPELIWLDGDQVIRLSGNLGDRNRARHELMTIAKSLRPASDLEWENLGLHAQINQS